MYSSEFSNISGIKLFEEPKHSQSNYWLQTIILNDQNMIKQDFILSLLNDSGYVSRPSWELLTNLTPFALNPSSDLSTAISLSKRIINIPSNFKV
jgi:perosamine synthetase